MADKPKVKIGSHWKRPPTKVYDYNYDVGEHYYKPMMRHLDKKSAGVSSETPGPKTFAERLVEDPLYGRSKNLNYASSDLPSAGAGRNSGIDSPSSRRPATGAGDLKDPFAGLGDDLLGRNRPSRLNMPSVSDQILEGAGMKLGDSLLDDALADIRSRRRPVSADPDDLTNDPFFAKAKATSDSLANKRRNLLKDMNDELEKIDSGLEKYGRPKGSSVDDLALTSSLSTSSSLNVKKRSVKATVTEETVRY